MTKVEIGGRRQGKSLRSAEMVKMELARGTAVFLAKKGGGFDRIVDVDLNQPVPVEPYETIPGPRIDTDSEEFRAAAARLEQRIRGAKENFVTRALAGTVTYADVAEMPAPTLDEIVRTIGEAMKAFGQEPPPFDVVPRYEPRMTVDPDWRRMDRLKTFAMSYPLYACKFPSALMMNVGDLGEPYVPRERWTWAPPDPAERALRLIAARPLDRRRLKRCLRIMGLR